MGGFEILPYLYTNKFKMSPNFSRSKERKPNRMKDFDYSINGAYFITTCVQDRIPYFGKIKEGKILLNEYGKIVQQVWNNLPKHYANCFLGEFVIMPNHVHGIIFINDNLNLTHVGEGLKPSPTKTRKTPPLSEIIRGFKTFSSRKINDTNTTPDFRWQRSFHDRIIRNEKELTNIAEYIYLNPQNWENDEFNLISL